MLEKCWRLVTLCVAFATLCGVIFFLVFIEHLTRPLEISEPFKFTIQYGDTTEKILHTVPTHHLMQHIWAHRLFLRLKRWDNHLHAGTYQIENKESFFQLYKKFYTWNAILYPLTIPEGLTTEQIYHLIRQASFLVGDIQDHQKKEVFLFPDTHYFHQGTSRTFVVQHLKDAGEYVLQKILEKKQTPSPLKTPHDVLILASIVEKETHFPEERPIIACIFLNRLSRNMRLQADTTVAYSLRLNGLSETPLNRKTLKTNSSYNTYLHKGLPPEPICHPGMASLEAIISPAKENFLYFVLDKNGKHIFSDSYHVHKKHHNARRQRRKKLGTSKNP